MWTFSFRNTTKPNRKKKKKSSWQSWRSQFSFSAVASLKEIMSENDISFIFFKGTHLSNSLFL